jgi:hypothetical protein
MRGNQTLRQIGRIERRSDFRAIPLRHLRDVTTRVAKRLTPPMNFKTVAVPEVPQGRNRKHKQIVTRILSDLDQVDHGMAIKVPLGELADS